MMANMEVSATTAGVLLSHFASLPTVKKNLVTRSTCLPLTSSPSCCWLLPNHFQYITFVFSPSFCHPPTPPSFLGFHTNIVIKVFLTRFWVKSVNKYFNLSKNYYVFQGIKYQSKNYHDILPFVHLAKWMNYTTFGEVPLLTYSWKWVCDPD